jgi:phosphoglycolate phosphatase
MKSDPKPTHFIFDLDGTLINSFPGISDSFCFAMRDILPHEPIPQLKPLIGPPIREMFQAALPHETKSSVFDMLVASFRMRYDMEGWRSTVLYPHVKDVLAHLLSAGRVCHIVTNKPLKPTLKILEYLGIMPLIKSIVSPEIQNPPFASKTEALLSLLRKFPLPPAESIFVGDSPDDAEAAFAAEIFFVAADYGFGAVSERVPHLISGRIANFSETLFYLK